MARMRWSIKFLKLKKLWFISGRAASKCFLELFCFACNNYGGLFPVSSRKCPILIATGKVVLFRFLLLIAGCDILLHVYQKPSWQTSCASLHYDAVLASRLRRDPWERKEELEHQGRRDDTRQDVHPLRSGMPWRLRERSYGSGTEKCRGVYKWLCCCCSCPVIA